MGEISPKISKIAKLWEYSVGVELEEGILSGLVETPTVMSGYIMINMTFSKIWCHFCICAYHYHHNDHWMHHQPWQPTEEIWKCISYHRTSKTFTELQIVIMMRTLINLICFQSILKVSNQFGNFENDLENLVAGHFSCILAFWGVCFSGILIDTE